MTELMAVEIARLQRNIHFEEYWKGCKNAHK